MDSVGARAFGKVVENGVQAIEEVKQLQGSGYSKDEIYVISHDRDREDRIVEAADANDVGLGEEGLFATIANIFRSRGDELRSKIQSLGFSEAEADFYEKELDLGKVLVIAKKTVS